MKITFFSIANIAYGGGYERQLVQLAEALKNKGHDVTILSSSKKVTYKLAIILSFLYLRPKFNFPTLLSKKKVIVSNKLKLKEFYSIKNLKKHIEKTDIVYAKNEMLDSILLRLIKTKHTPPLICGLHTLLVYNDAKTIFTKIHNIMYSSVFYVFLLQVFDIYHCINKQQQAFLSNNIKGKKIIYIPNFISVPKLKHKITKNSFKILFVGRLTKEKGIDSFIEVIKLLSFHKDFNHMQIAICGAGDFEYEIKSLTKKYKNVLYKGYIASENLHKEYLKADVLCVTSRGESFSLTCLEALSVGVPVIAFDDLALHDIIIQGKTGFLVPIGSINSFISKILMIKKYKSNIRKYKYMSTCGIKLVKEKYSKDVLIPKYLELFKI